METTTDICNFRLNFYVLKVSQGKVRWYNTSLFDRTLSNICTKNYWNRTTIVEIIVGGWWYPFFETQCSRELFKLR